MKKSEHTASGLLALAGGLTAVSGVLMVVCAKPAFGGILWAAAACMFSAARSFRLLENKKKQEEQDDGQETL